MGAASSVPISSLHETAGADEVLRQQLPARLNARRIFACDIASTIQYCLTADFHFEALQRLLPANSPT